MAYYSDDIIEEVKSANDIVDVISSYVSLKRKGNNYFGLCPFHREKTPSFSVAAEKQIYHCFGCGKGGNVIRFIMDTENISFREAVEWLADRAKITLPSNDMDALNFSQDELIIRENRKKNMYEINKIAGRLFYDNIQKSKVAQEYVIKRSIGLPTLKRFGLGFALDDNGLTKLLISKGFSEEDMLATGLVGKSTSGNLYDKFKNRFMFPIFDIRGRVVAFGGRCLESNEVMKAQRIPKYINSPENLIYTKGRHLYALNLARKSNDKIKKLLVVEGYMDVISPHQAGVTNVVASLGTALTEQQGRLIRQYAEEVILSYDSDSAGQMAIERGLEVLNSLGVSAKVLQMEGAKDPDEYVLKYGPDRFKKLIDNSISYAEYKIRRLEENYNLNDTTEKINFLTKMAEILAKIDNNIERDIYVDKFSQELGVGKEAILAEIEKKTIRSKAKEVITLNMQGNVKKNQDTQGTNLKMENLVIYLLSKKDEKVYQILKDNVSLEDVKGETQKSIIAKLYDIYQTGQINAKSIDTICDTEEEMNLLTEIMMNENQNNDVNKVLSEVVKGFQLNKLENRKKELIKELSQIDTKEKRELLENELSDVITRLGQLMIR